MNEPIVLQVQSCRVHTCCSIYTTPPLLVYSWFLPMPYEVYELNNRTSTSNKMFAFLVFRTFHNNEISNRRAAKQTEPRLVHTELRQRKLFFLQEWATLVSMEVFTWKPAAKAKVSSSIGFYAQL